MFWKVEALTAKRTEITQIIEGNIEDVKNQAIVYGLEIMNISPDYPAFIKSILQNKRLSLKALGVFFKDFADLQKCGSSINESISTLNETSSNIVLKEALKKIENFINDGRTIEESFENTKIFPKVVSVTLSAAEKTGNVPELLDLLSQYFRFKNENQKKITKSLIYPAVIFCSLTGVSVYNSVTLVPQLKQFLPTSASHNFYAVILIGYSNFIKEDWCWVLIGVLGILYFIKYLWDNNRERLMEFIFKVPMIGSLFRDIELAQVFMNLYVYQRSGINIIQTIESIYQANKTYVTKKLLLISERVYRGSSMGDAFKQDPFFPSFVHQNLTKGQASGNLPEYFERIYLYFDMKSKESIAALIAMVEPILLIMAALFLWMILAAFILPIYTNMNQLGTGTFK